MATRNISLQAELVDQVEDFVNKVGTYKSIADFVAEATRLRLEELNNKIKEANPK